MTYLLLLFSKLLVLHNSSYYVLCIAIHAIHAIHEYIIEIQIILSN